MGFWTLAQIFVNLLFFSAIIGIFIRLSRPQKDDPRLSKGLQLLQSKISVLEDLSDRTEVQVKQLTALMEQKVKEIQSQIQESEKQVTKIESAMTKSLEVAKIFQDKIPHSEIIERQNTIKYVKAARMAHQGCPIEEIAREVDLSRGEIEFIAKINRDHLQFSESDLPAWAQAEPDETTQQEIKLDQFEVAPIQKVEIKKDMSAMFEVPKQDSKSLEKIGEEFRKAVTEVQEKAIQESTKASLMPQNFIESFFEKESPAQSAISATKAATEIIEQNGKKMVIRPLKFPSIDAVDNLG